MSIVIAVGRWDAPGACYGRWGIRLCLGFVVVAVLAYDIDAALDAAREDQDDA